VPLSREGKERSFRENVLLAFSLAGVAGAVNAIGLAELGVLTSHVTGTATRLGVALGSGGWLDAGRAFALLMAFVLGAMSATLLIEFAKRTHHPRFQLPLLVETVLLTALTLLATLTDGPRTEGVFAVALALSVAMGLQNALVTRVSGAVVRTTHLTGLATDLGIELVRVGAWFFDRTRGECLLDRLRHVAVVRRDPELYRARLHATILCSFVLGCVVGSVAYALVGALAMTLPVCVLLALVAYDRHLAVSDEDLDDDFNPDLSP